MYRCTSHALEHLMQDATMTGVRLEMKWKNEQFFIGCF